MSLLKRVSARTRFKEDVCRYKIIIPKQHSLKSSVFVQQLTLWFVLLAARINKAPEAEVTPTSQQVNQPNDVVLDGSRKSLRYLSYLFALRHPLELRHLTVFSPCKKHIMSWKLCSKLTFLTQ